MMNFENGLALSMGSGVDIGINRAFAFRLVSLDYLRSWLSPLYGSDFQWCPGINGTDR
jgi:hypothetical protein